jgi:hypothetical protein
MKKFITTISQTENLVTDNRYKALLYDCNLTIIFSLFLANQVASGSKGLPARSFDLARGMPAPPLGGAAKLAQLTPFPNTLLTQVTRLKENTTNRKNNYIVIIIIQFVND